ncbi:hypothetical protein [Rhodovulum euryhalinum]|uniref:LysM domain-containing protein n=1 Tax=Rhodovulum euryhalinum TaxID=35805 RepID=A0A4V2SAG7_9RHOB|nr:hypothetical protein [Rhodovulum euryhalinum]TCO71650.1 hypothetical protein EV655_106142 [Rhodovulum euryhalinum]
MTGTLADRIKTAVRLGKALTLDYDVLIKEATNPKAPIAEVEVRLALGLTSIYRIAGILQGADVLRLLPQGLLPPPGAAPEVDFVTLESVRILLDTKAKTVARVVCVLGFGKRTDKGYQGLPWRVARIGAADLTLAMLGLDVGLDKPDTPDQRLAAASTGHLTLAEIDLRAEGSYPERRIEISQTAGTSLTFARFLGHFGLEAGDALGSLSMKGLDFVVEIPTKSGSVRADLMTASGDPLPLISDHGGKAILGLEAAKLSLAYSAAKTDLKLAGRLVAMEALIFDISAEYHAEEKKKKAKAAESAARWIFAGSIDVPATWKRLHPGATPPEKPVIGIAELAEAIVPGAGERLPSALGHLALGELSARYTREGDHSTAYEIRGRFDGTWALTADLHATLSVVLTEKQKTFAALVDMEGFHFELSLDLTEAEPKTTGAGAPAGTTYTITARIEAVVDRQQLKVTGRYDGKSRIALKFETEVNLAMMVAWFVGSATGQRFYVVPEPWDDILRAIGLPSDVDFSIDTETREVRITLGGIGFGFLAFRIDSVTLVYRPQDVGEAKSGITLEIGGRLPGGQSLAWDPATETPPEIPGKGGALVEIRTAAAGQHFAFDNVPAGIAEAVETVGKSLDAKAWTGTPELMHFDGNAGWLFAAHARILGQADLKFVFDDPDIYGVLITVGKGKNDKLNLLDGLYAEVLYRKVTDAVGVYEGTLTLPKSVSKVSLGAFEMTLPSFYLAIYTNGDFRIDVGFPDNLDFSKSLSLTVEIYSGAGGFYYARLDGIDPGGLPAVPPERGIFSPVTEIGLGLQIGIRKGFASGPLTAQFSVMVQGLFQGTFATYHDFETGRTDEFHDIRATVAVFGQLVGAIDFAIIKARVEVRIFVRADMAIVAHRATEIAFSAGVSVKVTVIINLGLFKISIHLGFDMVVHGAARFGQDSRALWDDTATVMLLAASGPPPAPVWQPVAPPGGPVPLTVYVLPALTAGADYTAEGAANRWIHVVQLALSNPQAAPGAGATLANVADTSYAAFLTGLMRWGLFAASGQAQAGGAPADQARVDGTAASRGQIAALIDALAGGARPGIDDIRALFRAGFQTRIVKPATPGAGQTLGVGFFPALPGMSVSVKVGDRPELALSPTPRAGEPMAGTLPGRGLAVGRGAVPAPPVDEVLSDYITLALRAGLQKAHDAHDLFQDGQPDPDIATILARLAPELGGLSGLTSRFMLHGTRQVAAGADAPWPLYALTGQQAVLAAGDMGAGRLDLALGFPAADQAAWGATLDGGGESIGFSSTDPEPMVRAPAALPATPDLTGPRPTLALRPAFDIRPVRFALAAGLAAGTGPETLWRLPPGLTGIVGQGASRRFTLYTTGDDGPDAKGTPVPDSAFAWALALDFQVVRIPLPGAQNPDAPEFLQNTYALASVNQKGLSLLQRLIADLSAETPAAAVSALMLGHRGGDGGGTGLDLQQIDFSDTFLVQSNFSTETRPPVLMARFGAEAAMPPDPVQALGFLGKLWSGGVTNSGGYFLCHAGKGQGLPDALFRSGGRATLTLVVGLAHRPGGGAPIPSCANALLGHALTADGAYFIASDDLTDAHPLAMPGQLAIELTRARPADPAADDPGTTLDQLFNLYEGRITAIGGTPPPDTGQSVFGPQETETETDALVYRHSFPLVRHADNLHAVSDGGDLPPGDNPYAHVGKAVEIGLSRVDLFGNLWAGGNEGGALATAHDDPLIPPSTLPYLAFSHAFEGGPQAPRLVVTPVLTPPVYVAESASDESARQRKSADLAAYAAAYYQIADIAGQAQVDATLTTSLLPGAALPVDVAALAADLLTAYRTIHATPIAPTFPATPPPVQPLTPLSAPVDPGGLAPGLAVPLSVRLTIARRGPFAPDVPADSRVRSVTLAVPPRMDAAPGGTSPLSLDAFKAGFKAAFGAHDRVLAAGADRNATGGDAGRQLWVVRYGRTGLSPEFATAPPPCFAPRPLSNRLVSRDVLVPTLAEDGTLSDSPGQRITVCDLDLDTAMRRLLDAIDAMFAPQRAIPAALVNRAALNRLAEAKKAIVEKLVHFVTEIRLDGARTPPAGAAALAAAQDRYRQECLIEMGNFYEMVSVAVLEVTTAVGGVANPEPMNLFGQTMPGPGRTGAPSTAPSYALTAGKAAVSPAGSPMAIGLFARNKTQQSTYVADLTFSLTAIEHELSEVRIGDTAFTSGGWLGFLDPPAPLSVGRVEIPIPLRAFPIPPDLVAQQALPRFGAKPGAMSAAEALARARSWVLEGIYRHPFVAQDRVELEVTVNSGAAGAMLLAVAPDVIDALIALDALLPGLQALFTREGLDAIRSPDRADNPVLRAALDSLADLAGAVVGASWTPITAESAALAAGTGLVERRRRFTIEDGVQARGQPWATRVGITGHGRDDLDIVPAIGIDGYETRVRAHDATSVTYDFVDSATGQPLTEEVAHTLAERRVRVEPAGTGAPFGTALNVIDRQNGTMAMQIVRNASFQEPFRYTTDWVRYPAPVAPVLDIAETIDIGGLAGPPGKPRPLSAHLAALYAALVAGSGTGETLPGRLQMEVSFAYPVTATGPATQALVPVRLPVLLRLPTEVTLGAPDAKPPAFLGEIADGIAGWLTANGLTPADHAALWATASLGLDVSLFAGDAPTGAPILRLRDLRLGCPAIALA